MSVNIFSHSNKRSFKSLKYTRYVFMVVNVVLRGLRYRGGMIDGLHRQTVYMTV